jgi:hypothetical protein
MFDPMTKGGSSMVTGYDKFYLARPEEGISTVLSLMRSVVPVKEEAVEDQL